MSILLRLSSFANWPTDAAFASPVVLANAGFMYSGRGDHVKCPVCHLEIQGCQDVNGLFWVRNEHSRRSPRCSLAATFAASDASLPSESTNDSSQTQSFSSSRTNNAAIAPCSLLSLNTKGTDDIRDNSQMPLQNSVSITEGASARTISNSTPIDCKQPNFDRLRSELERLSTYNDWPPTAHVKAADLAADGLFYTGQNDRVCCAFCRGILHQWTLDDVPSVEHRRLFPQCPFVNGHNVDNVPIMELPKAAAAEGCRLGAISKKTQHHGHVNAAASSDGQSKPVATNRGSDESAGGIAGDKSAAAVADLRDADLRDAAVLTSQQQQHDNRNNKNNSKNFAEKAECNTMTLTDGRVLRRSVCIG